MSDIKTIIEAMRELEPKAANALKIRYLTKSKFFIAHLEGIPRAAIDGFFRYHFHGRHIDIMHSINPWVDIIVYSRDDEHDYWAELYEKYRREGQPCE